MTKPIHCLAIVAVSLIALPAAHAARGAYAVIVGNNASLDADVQPLQYADDDALRYSDVFRLLGVETAVLVDLDADTGSRVGAAGSRDLQRPTRNALLQALAVLNTKMAADRLSGYPTELYFVFTGHGSVDEDGEGYLNLAESRLRRSDLMDHILRPSQADTNHVIIDACQSFFMANARGDWVNDRVDADFRGLVTAHRSRYEIDAFANTGLFLSTATEKQSHEWQAYRGGVFSHQVRSGLLGAADVNGDGRVDYFELEAYVAAANGGVTDERAKITPFVRAPANNGRQAIIALGAAPRRLSITAEVAGAYYLEDEQGVRWADFHKAADSAMHVSLADGRAYWVRSDKGELRIAPNGSVVLASLNLSPLTVASRGTIGEALQRQLYRVPFGAVYFQGFMDARSR